VVKSFESRFSKKDAIFHVLRFAADNNYASLEIDTITSERTRITHTEAGEFDEIGVHHPDRLRIVA